VVQGLDMRKRGEPNEAKRTSSQMAETFTLEVLCGS
jgi:hypothetical protein